MSRLLVGAGLLLSLVLSTQVFGQSTYAKVSGTIEDMSGALLPSVSVTAKNSASGVVNTVVSNESRSYNFATLLPGVYKVSAQASGFQTKSFTDVQLGGAQQVRLDFTLSVASVATAIEVIVAADTQLAASSASIGEVLTEQELRDLPTVTNNVLELLPSMPGARIADDGVNGTFAGLRADQINITRDGVNASGSARYPQAGAQTATFLNPDLIGEVRMITAPVDAELGRGNGQIQFWTRSGSNRFHGSAVWSARNTALDANTWNNNNDIDPKTGKWTPTKPDWNNNHQFTGSYGGPIVKNKTFFFALYDGLLVNSRTVQNPVVLTPCARNGIFRYFDNWNNANAIQPTNASGGTSAIPVVDGLGNPMKPATNPDGSPFTGALRYASVFGRLANTPEQPDCSDARLAAGATPWDANRKAMDSTGFVTKLMGKMPMPNNYDVGEGLNTAGYRWNRNERGGTESIFGVNAAGLASFGGLGRKQINTKIDHNFNANHKLGASYTYERSAGNANYSTWPNGLQGSVFRQPQILSLNFTSTLTANIVNEARVGMRRTGSNTYSALNDPERGKDAQALLPNYNGYPVVQAMGAGVVVNFQANQIFGGSSSGLFLDTTVLWQYGDSLSWTKGKHVFKMGAEIRRTHTLGQDSGGPSVTTIPRAVGGDTALGAIPATAIGSINMPGLAGTTTTGNNVAMRNLLSFLAGSLSSVTQLRFMQSPTKLDAFEDYKTFPSRARDFHGNESSIFFKDDWKARKSLTLNLGLRWDYYGVPYEASGLMPAAVGGPAAIWGISGSGFADWMKPGVRGSDTKIAYFGKNSPNPGTPWYENDWNNFGPSVGFAWQVPWFGAGKTAVRGGYQITYEIGQSGNALGQENSAPGSVDAITYLGDSSANAYLDLTKLQSLIPAPSVVKPMQPVPTSARTQAIFNPEKGIVTPYTQNLTLSVTRSLRSNLTVDLRYVGTLARKQWNPVFNINAPNFLYNGLKEAFDAARAGNDGSPALQVLENMFKGINIAGTGFGPVGFVSNGVLQTAGMHLRAFTITSSNLANGNYAAVAATLNTLNYNTLFNPTLPVIPAGVNGAVMRYNGLPENFIVANPQFGVLNLITNDYSTNYHSFEAHVTVRQTHGFSSQFTYTWSKNLGAGGPFGVGPTFTNPADRHADYSLQTDTRVHDFRTSGTFALPIGPNKLFFGKSSGATARIIEGWQTGWTANVNSGQPLTITGQTTLYGNGRPDIVGPFPKGGKVTWEGTQAQTGSYYAPGAFTVVRDPQCTKVAAALTSLCTLNAIADATGQILLQNALPGTPGTLGLGSITGPGRWRFDANLSKSIRIGETESMQLRVVATDVLNHPEPATPTLNLTGANAANFGLITSAAGLAKSNLHRQFQAQLRFNF